MANLYFFFDNRRPGKDGRGTLKIALSHKQKVVYHSLDIRLLPDEWNGEKLQIIGRADKKFLNVEIRKKFSQYVNNLVRIEDRSDYEHLSTKEIMDMIVRGESTVETPKDMDYVIPVYNEYIESCRKTSTAQVYKSSLRNLMDYCEDIDTLTFRDINLAWLRKYQNWLLGEREMSVNGANVYLRNLRTIFNYAINNQFTRACYPFRNLDMSTTEPDRRMIPYEKWLAWVTMPMEDNRVFYRDLFMLSFYLCGIRPVDLLHAKKSDVREGRLVYYPEKLNGRTKLSIKIEPEAWEIIHKYEGEEYLLNIMESRTDYKAFMKHWNSALKAIGDDEFSLKTGRNGAVYTTVKHVGIVPYMTIYYARTCWATYAYNVTETPMDIISQALGHKSGLRVTNFYVKRDIAKVDDANRQLIDRVNGDIKKWREKQAGA